MRIHPEMVEARRCLQRKAYQKAHSLCLEVVKKDASAPEPYLLLGLLALDHGNFSKALDLFDRAVSLGHPTGEADAHAARCLIALNRRDEAVARAHRAAAQGPQSALVEDTLGVVLSRAGRHEAAVAHYRRATMAAPDEAGYQYNLGAALQFLGDFDGARAAFDRCLAADPGETRAWIARVSITRQTPDENDLAALDAAWTARDTADVDTTLQLAHALAKAWEDLGHPGEAMAWLARGKAAKRATLPDRETEDRACFAAAQQLAATLRPVPQPEGDGPIFIVGMPRTGTTLVDRILTSHPDMTSAGELSDFSVALKRISGTPGRLVLDPETLAAAARVDLAAVGLRYLDTVRGTLGLSGRFTDKMPLNVFFVPALLTALPGARVICLRRHPADTVLSNYRQLFATAFSYYAYAYDLAQTARYTVAFNRLIDTYEATLPPGRFRIVDYEDVVADQEAVTRRLLEMCGLPFDPACLAFHENAAPVATASATQVRQPIYTSSMGRWVRYRPAMDPALAILSEAGLMVAPGDLGTGGDTAGTKGQS